MKLINELVPGVWPMVIIICVIVISLRLSYLMMGKKKFNIYEELFNLIFIIYVLCLFHIVTYQDVNYGTNNFIPFKEMFRYDIGSYKFYKNIIGNILLFLPYGFFVSNYLESKKIYRPIVLSIIVSTTIEAVQYYIGRVFDIDDIILNVIGAVLGYLVYRLFNFLKTKFSKLLKGEGTITILIIIIIVLILLYSFDINIFSMINGFGG